jgi:hypothetical protein
MGFDPHSGKKQSEAIFSVCKDKIDLVVQSCKVPILPFPRIVIPVCRITNGGCGRKTLIVMSNRYNQITHVLLLLFVFYA